jgi:hypothetical protein
MYGSNDDSTNNSPAASQTGDFLNRNLLRIDPKSGITSRYGLTDPRSNMPVTSSAPSTFARQLAALGNMPGDAGKSASDPADAATRKVQQYTPPTPYRDTQGKTLPQYRMGIGHRILGTLANFANGFAGNRTQPIYVGPGALNNRYYQDEQQRRQNLEGAQSELWTYRSPSDKYRDAVDWRTIGKDPTSGKWIGRTYGGERRELGTPPWEASGEEDDDTPNNNGSETDSPETASPSPLVQRPPRSEAVKTFVRTGKNKSYR